MCLGLSENLATLPMRPRSFGGRSGDCWRKQDIKTFESSRLIFSTPKHPWLLLAGWTRWADFWKACQWSRNLPAHFTSGHSNESVDDNSRERGGERSCRNTAQPGATQRQSKSSFLVSRALP